jgi:outer membrane protein TolC
VSLLLWAVPHPTVAGDGTEPEFQTAIDLPRLRSYTLANNPDIEAAAQRWQAAQARPSQEGSLSDPMINTAYHNESFVQLRQGTEDFTNFHVGAEQEVPFPGKLQLKETVAAREADREGAVYRATVLNVVTRLRLAYDDYYLADKSIEIVRSNRELLDKLAKVAEARYGVGEGLQQDVARAQVELSILLGRLTNLEQERQSAAAMVNAVLNRPPAAALGPPTAVEKRPLAYTLDQLSSLATEQSPSLSAARFGVARAETSLQLAKRQYYPDFVLRADYFNKGTLVPEWEVGAGIRVPLYFWRKQSFGVREAAAVANEARASQQSTSQEVLARLKDLYAQATSADRLVELYGNSVTPQAEVSLDSASAGYQVGKVDFITLLNSFTVLNDYRVRYYEEQVKFDKAVAQIEEAAGILPDERP